MRRWARGAFHWAVREIIARGGGGSGSDQQYELQQAADDQRDRRRPARNWMGKEERIHCGERPRSGADRDQAAKAASRWASIMVLASSEYVLVQASRTAGENSGPRPFSSVQRSAAPTVA